MQFNSYEFILMFLPINLIVFFTIGRINIQLQKLIICAAGLVLFAFSGFKGTFVLIASMIINYLICEIMMETEYLRKIMFILAIAANVLILFVFKYSDFVIGNVNDLFGKSINYLNLSLPLGISFFTFQQIAYVANVYNGKIPEVKFLDYAAYILYFPKIIMGPIVDPVKLIEDINNPNISHWNWDNFVSGLKMFCFGLFKKLVIADTFALAVSWGSENLSEATSLDMILVMLSYTFEIYFDFSGYSDMAIGVSNIMNIALEANFNSPYKALSVRDFWDRWHMSLTGFLTKYIYIPLGGSRKGNVRTYLNVLIVFTISGIWHGANWTFILWGVLYGVFSVIDRIIEPFWKKVPRIVRWIITFGIVNIMWLLFNAGSVGEWINDLKLIILGGSFTLSTSLAECFRGVEMPFFEDLLGIGSFDLITSGTAWMLFFMAAAVFICLVPKNNKQTEKNNNYLYMILAALAFTWSFLYLGSESVFIYNYF